MKFFVKFVSCIICVVLITILFSGCSSNFDKYLLPGDGSQLSYVSIKEQISDYQYFDYTIYLNDFDMASIYVSCKSLKTDDVLYSFSATSTTYNNNKFIYNLLECAKDECLQKERFDILTVTYVKDDGIVNRHFTLKKSYNDVLKKLNEYCYENFKGFFCSTGSTGSIFSTYINNIVYTWKCDSGNYDLGNYDCCEVESPPSYSLLYGRYCSDVGKSVQITKEDFFDINKKYYDVYLNSSPTKINDYYKFNFERYGSLGEHKSYYSKSVDSDCDTKNCYIPGDLDLYGLKDEYNGYDVAYCGEEETSLDALQCNDPGMFIEFESYLDELFDKYKTDTEEGE